MRQRPQGKATPPWRTALVLALLASSPASAGAITCADQVNAARASLASRLDRASREKLDEASGLCRENRRAEALTLVQQVRDAVSPSQATSGRDH
jgi:hypothetical protein